MEIKERIKELGNEASKDNVSHNQRELLEAYKLINWFFDKTTNEYLGQNENSVLKSIRTDKPPKVFKDFLLKSERKNKNREKVIEVLS